MTESLSGGQSLSMTETQAAVDAQFTVNGISLTKSANTVSDVISGVTFTLKAITAAPVEVTVENDADAAVAGLKELITAYNEVNTYANSQARYDAEKKQAGILAGDATSGTRSGASGSTDRPDHQHSHRTPLRRRGRPEGQFPTEASRWTKPS